MGSIALSRDLSNRWCQELSGGATQIRGGNSLAAFGKTQGRPLAGHYRGLHQLEGMRGQAQGRPLRGYDGTGATWSGETRSIRHLPPMSAPGRRGVLSTGGRCGGGALNCSGQWSATGLLLTQS